MINDASSRISGLVQERFRKPSLNPAIPCITLTYAQSIDGSIAAGRGIRTSISGDESLTMTHTLRSIHDAILVGIGTILTDDPQLNVRFPSSSAGSILSNPQPIILDSNLRTPTTCKLLVNKSCVKPVIFCNDHIDLSTRKAALEKAGAVIIPIKPDSFPSRKNYLCLDEVCIKIKDMGFKSLMVEGGATLLESFLSAQNRHLIASLVITIAPKFILGGLKVGSPSTLDTSRPDVITFDQLLKDTSISWIGCGADIVFVASF